LSDIGGGYIQMIAWFQREWNLVPGLDADVTDSFIPELEAGPGWHRLRNAPNLEKPVPLAGCF
jgi:hypothetical protein